MANLVIRMLDRTIQRQKERDQAIDLERSRINRDVHDNIGVQLLGALHSSDPDRKDSLIRQTMTNLRQIIAQPPTEGAAISTLLADLRGELSEHLEASGIRIFWQDDLQSDNRSAKTMISSQLAQTVQAVLRESVSNILRHSGAKQAWVTISGSTMGDAFDDNQRALSIDIADDGQILSTAWCSTGNGLVNMRERVKACGGAFNLTQEASRTHLNIILPLQQKKLAFPHIDQAFT